MARPPNTNHKAGEANPEKMTDNGWSENIAAIKKKAIAVRPIDQIDVAQNPMVNKVSPPALMIFCVTPSGAGIKKIAAAIITITIDATGLNLSLIFGPKFGPV
jgi:hypothetical protein